MFTVVQPLPLTARATLAFTVVSKTGQLVALAMVLR